MVAYSAGLGLLGLASTSQLWFHLTRDTGVLGSSDHARFGLVGSLEIMLAAQDVLQGGHRTMIHQL